MKKIDAGFHRNILFHILTTEKIKVNTGNCKRILQDPVGGRSNGAKFAANRSDRARRFHKVLFQFGNDVFAVGVLAERVQVRPNFVHQNLTLRWFAYVDHFLNYVVGVLVFHHHVKSTKKKYIPLI